MYTHLLSTFILECKSHRTTTDKSERKGSLYNASIEMPYDNTSPKCTKSLEVSCNIRNNTIVQNVYTTSNECSPRSGKHTQQGNLTLEIDK